MAKLLRLYSIASLIGILLTAVALTLFYRQVTAQGIMDLAETHNLALAETALNAVHPELVRYLASVADAGGRRETRPLPPEVARAVIRLMRDSPVKRVKIYDRSGIVAFSTRATQIGRNQRDNPGFAAAINGLVANRLTYRDAFNVFEAATEEDNLAHTYLPVRASPTEPVIGVFELYTDVDHLVRRNERTVFLLMAGGGFLLALLYAGLLLLVRRAGSIIESQQHTIRERTATLEILSAQMLRGEELERKRVATELHEGLAQTLSAIKVYLEGAQRAGAGLPGEESPNAVGPLLKKAIREVRAIAVELRPPSLDEVGLLATLDWYCREFERLYPGIRIDRKISVQEQAIPVPLKIVLYRIVESAFKNLARRADTDRIRLALKPGDQAIALVIESMPEDAAYAPRGGNANAAAELQLRFADVVERATLSGGICTVARNAFGGISLRASWPC